MSGAQIFDLIGNVGGVAALLTLILNTYIRNWIAARFATKAELEKHEQQLVTQSEGLRLQLRSQALGKLLDQRFSNIDLLFSAHRKVIGAVSYCHSVVSTTKKLEEENPPDLIHRKGGLEAEFYKRFSALADSLGEAHDAAQMAKPYLPDEVFFRSADLLDIAGDIMKQLHQQIADEESIDELGKASAALSKELRIAVEDAPNMADLLLEKHTEQLATTVIDSSNGQNQS